MYICASGVGLGEGRFLRSLSVSEIVDQVRLIFDELSLCKSSKPVLFSAMGEGEPLLNYDNVIKAFKIFEDYPCEVRLALSTSGSRVGAIYRLAREEWRKSFKLQLSLHSARSAVRSALIPSGGALVDVIASGVLSGGLVACWSGHLRGCGTFGQPAKS